MMKKRRMFVEIVAQDVRVKNQDLRGEYPMNYLAEKELSTLQTKVSPEIYGMLVQQLMAFHPDMQLEMAEDMVIFAFENVVHTTGCQSVDMSLDACYMWIANDMGIIKPDYSILFDGNILK